VLEPPGPGLPAVFGDPGELQQAFLNLLMNSLDAVRDREDGGTISVRVEVAEGLVRAHVEDDGCGMEPGQVERAFDLFYTTKEVGEGTGLGLSIVHHIIVENHGGQLDLVSRPGKGTEITVSLPIRAAGGPPGGPQAV
jgi:signal transduction histidine kinase